MATFFAPGAGRGGLLVLVAIVFSGGCTSPRTEVMTGATLPGPTVPGGTPGASDGGGGAGGGAGGTGATDGPVPSGGCTTGATRCAEGAPAVEVCTASGAWVMRDSCASVCAAGACGGMCKPGERHCGAEQKPEGCGPDGAWVADPAPCPYVCTGLGVCGGECKPGNKQCGGAQSLTPQLCDENGHWVASGPICQNLCSSGSCGGSCMPGKLRCTGGAAVEACSPMGTWEPDKKCDFVCTGDGVCGGVCKPGSTRCGAAAVQTCAPDGSGWMDSKPCPLGCDPGKLACITECRPGQTSDMPCERCGKRTRTCTGEGTWGAYGGCEGQKECEAGMTRNAACGRCGTRVDRCSSACTWTAGGCGGEGECAPGSTQRQPCGMCGTRTDTCNDSCRFVAGSCSGEHGACDPQSTPRRMTACGKCNRGTRTDTCNSSCNFSNGSCSDPDADVGKVSNAFTQTLNVTDVDQNTGHGGNCSPGFVRDAVRIDNVSGTLQCESLGFARLVGSDGGFAAESDPKWCGVVVFTAGTGSCRVTVTQKRVCP
jgi:hypothetical protein